MASVGAAVATQKLGLTFQAGPGWGLIGFALLAGAGYIDQQIAAALTDQPNDLTPDRLLDIPTNARRPAAPRVFALGRRVRIPVHAIWQAEKVIERNVGGGKAGPQGVQREVRADIAIGVNDRITERLVQLVANGKLLYYQTRNLQSIRTPGMTVSVVSGQLLLTMQSVAEPDWADKFEVGDVVELSGFISTAGPNLNIGATGGRSYWEVAAVTAHQGTTASVLTLDVYSGHNLTGLVATAGTEVSPASVTRVDDAFVEHSATITRVPTVGTIEIDVGAAAAERAGRVFRQSDRVRLAKYTPTAANGVEWIFLSADAGTGLVILQVVGSLPAGSFTAGTSTDAGSIEFWRPQTYEPGTFADGFVATDHFYRGTDVQDADDLIEAVEGVGNVPGFRGMSYQVMQQMELTRFGNQVPIMEALIDPDVAMDWQQAIRVICERSGVTDIDVSGVTATPFEGYYIRGTLPGTSALQPLLVAGQIATQERDGTLAFFDIDNADVVAIENGARFSDLGAVAGSDTPLTGDKIVRNQIDERDLPTSLTVRHQDPDNLYSDGAQPYGLRSPSGVDHKLPRSLDLSQLVLTRKQARNLATTALRRAWINSETVEMSLPMAYLDLLENDLVTVTDDAGNDIVARVIRVEIGANLLVNVLAVREQVNIGVTGSPVQGTAGTVPPTPPQAAILQTAVIDIPSIDDDFARTPGLVVAACAESGGQWRGATVFESVDGGTSFDQVGILQFEQAIGTTVTDLAASATIAETLAGGPFWDFTSAVEVDFASLGEFQVASVSQAAVLQGVNWFLIGDEIVGAANVTIEPEGTRTLSTLLRGLRGTYNSSSSLKAAGQRVVQLFGVYANGLFRPTPARPGASRVFRVVPVGRTLADVEDIAVTAGNWNARPFPVRDVTKTIDVASFDATFALHHWTRLQNPVGYTGPYALDEAFEEYVVRIYDPTNTTLVRTKTATTRGSGSNTFRDDFVIPYSAIEQSADGYTLGASTQFWVEIAQLGEFGEGATWRQQL